MELQNLPWYGQLLVFLLIGGIFFGIFYMAYYKDNQQTIERMLGDIDKLDQEINNLRNKQRQIEKIEQVVARARQQLEKLKEILPEETEVSMILRRTQALISTNRLRILNYTTQRDIKQDIYTEHPVGISVDCGYHNLAIFFDQLSKLKKIFNVKNLSIRTIAQSTRNFSANASFTVSTYTLKEDNVAKGAN